jgi:hypothetical protein
MTLRENTPRDVRPGYGAPTDRLEALAALWARQTGRSIVVTGRTAASASPASAAGKA